MHDDTCILEGCTNPIRVKKRGLCMKHYAKWQRHGDPTAGVERGTNPATCTHEGCDRPYDAGGYCNAHYLRARSGRDMLDPIRVLTRDPEVAFMERTRREGDCLVWIGVRNEAGYGVQTTGGSRSRKPGLAHRYAWERENGPIPSGLEVDHICHNPACVRVEHLRLASRRQNAANRAGARPSVTGVRNVYPKGRRFRVQIMVDGVAHHLGIFDSIEDATEVAAAGRARLFGEFAGRG